MSIKDNIDMIRKELDANVTLVAVSKTKPVSMITEAIEGGITDIGENYLQEAEEKFVELNNGVKKHFIGHIQSNKIKKIVELFDVIQSVDRLKVLSIINKEAEAINKVMPIMIEVNISGEKNKSGIKPEELDDFILECDKLGNVELVGLMTIGPLSDDDEISRDAFRRMYKLFDGRGLKYLSMGMTHDYKIAVEEGSNMIRVGTGIFGERDYSNKNT